MKTFVINLDRDKDRLDWMSEETTRVGLSFERIAACQGDALADWLKPLFYRNDNEPHAPLNKGEIGCYASHLTIHKRILDENIDGPVLILEDDVRFKDHFPLVLENLDKLPGDWEIVRLTNRPKAAYLPVSHLAKNIEAIRYWRVPNSTGAYLINAKGADKFLNAYETRMRPIDQDMRCPWEHRLQTYGLSPTPITPDIFESSIDGISTRGQTHWRKRDSTPIAPHAISLRSYKMEVFGLPSSLKAMVKNLSVSVGKRLGKKPKNEHVFRL